MRTRLAGDLYLGSAGSDNLAGNLGSHFVAACAYGWAYPGTHSIWVLGKTIEGCLEKLSSQSPPTRMNRCQMIGTGDHDGHAIGGNDGQGPPGKMRSKGMIS